MEIWGLIFQWFLWVLLEALGIILVLGLNFPWNRLIFLRICPRKSFENWLFSAKIPRNGPIFQRILTFLPRKSPKIGRDFREFWLFSCKNAAKSVDFSTNLPLKIPRNFAFFPRNIRRPDIQYEKGKLLNHHTYSDYEGMTYQIL